MKVLYFVIINIIALTAILGTNIYAVTNNMNTTGSAYFWIMSYTFVIGCSIMGMNCRNQILRLEELITLKLSMEPTDEELSILLDTRSLEEDAEERYEVEELKEESIKNRLFKKRA